MYVISYFLLLTIANHADMAALWTSYVSLPGKVSLGDLAIAVLPKLYNMIVWCDISGGERTSGGLQRLLIVCSLCTVRGYSSQLSNSQSGTSPL